MSEVTLYDSHGYPLDDPDGERNERIRNMSRYGVVFTISYTQPYEMATYFRAYESASGRMEQYYATYTTSSNRALLREFRDAVVNAAEKEHGLEIEHSESGENILSNLDTDDPGQIGSERQRSRARELLSGGERLRFGVGSYEKAFKLISELAGARAGMEVAVTEGESTHTGPMSTYDLIVEKGPHMGLKPLGQTQALMNPDPDLSNETPDEDPFVELAIDVGYGVAIAALLVVLYTAIASLLFSPLGLTVLPGAAEVPWSHSVDISQEGERTVVVRGSTPADTLVLQYLNGTNSTTNVVSRKTIRVEDHGDHSSFTYTSKIPADATGVRVRYQGILSWTVAPKDGLLSINAGNSDSTAPDRTSTPSETPTSTATTPESTSTPTPTATTPESTSTPTPTNRTTSEGTNTTVAGIR